jgi:hypothetical protein
MRTLAARFIVGALAALVFSTLARPNQAPADRTPYITS